MQGKWCWTIAMALLAGAQAAMAAPKGWERVEAASPPPARFDHTITLDPASGKLVLFGGRNGSQTLGDTWVFDLGERVWHEAPGSGGPAPRFGHAAAYDPSGRRVLLFAGQGTEGFFNDVWAFDGVNETWRKLETQGPLPVKRYGTAAAVDTKRNRLLITHGFAAGRFDDTWALDLATNTWSQLAITGGKPLKRCLHEAVYDMGTDRLILFGGCSSGAGPCPQGDLWTLDGETHAWTEIRPAGAKPAARQNPGLVSDGEGRVYLFGGETDQGASADVWVLDVGAKQWTELSSPTAAPTPRWSHDAVWDAGAGRLLVVGGVSDDGALNDMWMFTP
jgi:hypothetical protein